MRIVSALARAWVVWALVLAAAPSAAASTAWRIDPTHTNVRFWVDAIGFPRTNGHFSSFVGQLSLDLVHPERCRVAFRVAAASVDVGSPSFDDYLRSEAFFDVAHHPNIEFVSTAVKVVDPSHAEVTGDLTLRGVTRPFTIAVAVNVAPTSGARRLGFTATGTIPRLAYGMSAGFPAISNDVSLIVTTSALAP
ncbi:MAG TPA: YceI family protein [Roseiarcus sp.]|nr:YceI family protein [Roseiarcus sp.]